MDHVDDITELARLAEQTDGCLTVHQIRECGYSKRQIDTLTRRGILRRVLIGVYVLCRTTITHQQVVRAALLAAGPSSHVAGRTALEMRGAVKPHRGGHFWIGVVGGQRRPLRRTRIPLDATGRSAVIHFIRAGAPVETERRNGVPVALVARALVDAAARESASMMRKIVREAEYLRLLAEDQLHDEFDRARRGTRALRAVLPAGPLSVALAGGADSRAAQRLLRGLVERGLVPTSVDQPLRTSEIECRPDFFYAAEQLVVEADGPQHELPERRAEDEARDEALARVGILTLRIPTGDIRRALEPCVARVADALRARRVRDLA